MILESTTDHDPAAGLELYSRIRVPRARRVQQVSHRNANFLHLPDGPAQRARDALLGSGGDPMRDNDWLFAHDVRDDAAAVLGRTVSRVGEAHHSYREEQAR